MKKKKVELCCLIVDNWVKLFAKRSKNSFERLFYPVFLPYLFVKPVFCE